jgi:adenylate cyclase, class 2
MSMIEVEAKYRIESAADVRQRLRALGGVIGESVQHADEYFAHPARDFARTNEAFRIRSIGDENRLTYKGPLLDQTTKTRKEIEIAFASGRDARESMRSLLTSLGFRSVRVVEKVRQQCHVRREGLEFEVCLDEVAALGSFVELETSAAEDQWEPARDALVRLAGELHLAGSERRSYLELLLAAGNAGSQGD